MARPKKTAKRTSGTKSTARGNAQQQTHDHAKMSADIKTQTAQIKLLKGNDLHRRPPNNPDMPQNIIDALNTDFNSIKELLDSYSQHLRALDRSPKAYGFWAGSLRYAQTPHINSWSFAKHKLLQKSILSCQIKKTIKTTVSSLAKLPCYPA